MSQNEQSRWESLCEFGENSRQTHQVPGVVVGILHNQHVSAAGFGITNVDHPLHVTDHTLFQIGSITKTYTGTLILKLVEEGKVSLDATVRTYVPEFRVADAAASEAVTIRHLLTHTSGWFGDFFQDTGAGEDACAIYVAKMADLEQLAPIGQVWSYNNAGFYLLGQIIEVVTGKSYQDALREMVLAPLGLQETYFDPADVMTHRFACGHINGRVARPWPLPRAAYAAGGIACSVHDLLTYARFHLGDGTLPNGSRLLQPASLAQMHAPHVSVWQKEQWGLTWSVNDSHGSRLLSHGGGTTGQISLLTVAPEHDFAVAVFTNSGDGGRVTQEVTRQALKEYLQIEITDPEPRPSSGEELAPYVGTYTRPFADIHIGMLGGRLIAQMIYKMGFPSQDTPPRLPPPPSTLGLIEEDRLMVLDGPMKSGKLDIVRKPDGSIGWLRAGRIHRRVP